MLNFPVTRCGLGINSRVFAQPMMTPIRGAPTDINSQLPDWRELISFTSSVTATQRLGIEFCRARLAMPKQQRQIVNLPPCSR
jgi:hypothetical protein